MSEERKGLIEIDDLKVSFPSNGTIVQAVDGGSMKVEAGEFVSLIGPSGCGKSTRWSNWRRWIIPTSRARRVWSLSGRAP